MLDTSDFIQTLLHAESRYDPVKAHEYYIRTRELKGRRSVSDLKTDKKKRAWEYVKSEVEEERRESLEQAAERQKQVLAQFRANGELRRAQIRDQLRTIMELIGVTSKTERERIANEVEQRIAALPEMPSNLSKKAAAEFAAKRREEIAKIRGEAKVTRQVLSDTIQTTRAQERAISAGEREQVSSEVRASIDTARQAYEMAREAIKAKYESELDREYNAIRRNVR